MTRTYKTIIECIRYNKENNQPRLYLLDDFMWYKWPDIEPKARVSDKNTTRGTTRKKNHRIGSSLKEYQDCPEIQ